MVQTTANGPVFDEYGDLISQPTLAMVKHALAQHSMTIRKVDGEYRVAHREDDVRPPKAQITSGKRGRNSLHVGKLKFKRLPKELEPKSERCAYYTNDLEDALHTGLAMRKSRIQLYAARAGFEHLLNDND